MTSDIDLEKLGDWLGENAQDIGRPSSLKKFAGGQSNPTYRLETSEGAFVLRRKPFGELLPSAHAVDREFQLISGLFPTGFPVPRPIALCEDSAVIGAMFYIMELIDGETYFDGRLPSIEKTMRADHYRAMITTLADLHAVDISQPALANFQRSGNYFARQVSRWIKQYRIAQTDDIETVEKLIEWLPTSIPEQTHTSLIHGDYRIDNLIFDRNEPVVRGVIDWELATCGDPLADITYLLMHWIMPADGKAAMGGLDLEAAGVPSLDEAAEIYCERAGREALPNLDWYFAYNLFRLVGIIQGIKKRVIDGNASSQNAEEAVARLIPLADEAWHRAQLSGAR
ncbi:phosphotransferase family protein [Hyphococcus formosus]|uniref:phosphotransferase family protein n=1 Tax=Hyphococcus formosus TaxID=3143534 RepID=UPI00398B020B